jgi:DNA-binding NtrC family response regulator
VDLLITDYLMPGMTGGQLIELVHAERPELPVIIVTGFAEVPEHVAQRVLRLPKPFDQAELRLAIRRAVEDNDFKSKVVPLRKRE